MAEIPINYLKYIDQDGTEKKVYPITVTDAVYDSDGNKLSNVLLGVLKDTDISNVQSDSTTTVPSSALLKATDDKIGDTSSLPGDAGNVVSAINQLNSDFGIIPQPNCDLDHPPAYNIFIAKAPSTNLPSGIGGNSVMCFQQFTDNGNYNALLCFGFGSDKIAIKRKNNSSEWTAWKYITLS